MEVTVPEIEAMRLAHYTTIASECTASLSPYLEKLYVFITKLFWFLFSILLISAIVQKYFHLFTHYHWTRNIAELGCDARVGLSIYRSFSSKEYLNAQRLRYFAHPIQQKYICIWVYMWGKRRMEEEEETKTERRERVNHVLWWMIPYILYSDITYSPWDITQI